MVRAKFRVISKRFWQCTPAGRIEMSILNPAALDAFEVGGEYYVDFIQADPKAA